MSNSWFKKLGPLAGLVFVIGRDFFPKVDAGQIRLHFRARTGTFGYR